MGSNKKQIKSLFQYVKKVSFRQIQSLAIAVGKEFLHQPVVAGTMDVEGFGKERENVSTPPALHSLKLKLNMTLGTPMHITTKGAPQRTQQVTRIAAYA